MRAKYIIIALLSITLQLTTLQTNAQLNKYYFYNQARTLISQDKHADAIAMLNQLIVADNSLAEAWFLRGLAKYNLSDMQGALADFSKAIEQNPVFSQALLYRGVVLGRLTRYPQAKIDFDMAIDLRPNWAEGYFSRGVNFLLMQQTQRSIDDFSKVIDFEPRNVDAWINRGTSYLYHGDSLRALNDYAQAIKLNPFYAEGYSKRGRLLMEMKNYHLATDDLSKAIELDSTLSINYFLRALTHNYNNNFTHAIDDLNKAIELSPNNALSIYNRALLSWRIGKKSDALEDFDRVATLNPENLLVYYNRGILQLELNDLPEAVDDFTKAIEIFPDFANAYRARSSAYAQLGNYAESELDRNFAQSIAEKYSDRHNQPLTDTTSTFDNLIAFNSDFSPKTTTPLLDELASSTIDILPFIRVVIVSTNELSVLNQQFAPLDTINVVLKNYGYALTFSILNTQAIPNDITLSNSFSDNLIKGIALSTQRRYNESIDAYEEALAISSNNPLALINLAAEKADMVNFVASFEMEHSEVALGQRVRNASSVGSLGNAQLESYTESLEINQALLSQLKNNPIIQYNQANIYAMAGHMDEAVELYTRAMSTDAELAPAWYNRGLIHFMQKENQQGCFDMGKAGELGIRQAYLLIHRFCRR